MRLKVYIIINLKVFVAGSDKTGLVSPQPAVLHSLMIWTELCSPMDFLENLHLFVSYFNQ